MAGRANRDKVDSIFLGGGTPSLLSVVQMTELLTQLRTNFNVMQDCEITLEANPCTLDAQKLQGYRAAGVNRLSIGLQAIQPEHLQLLGRMHTAQQFDAAFDAARKEGFDNINIDVMYALPGQTFRDFKRTLDYVISLRPEHVSAYALKLEPGTYLHRLYEAGQLPRVDEELDVQMYHLVQYMLRQVGYKHYEISNFAYGGKTCRHNLKYWQIKDYLGLGVAAHSCVQNIRFANTDNLKEYIGNMQNFQMRYAQSEVISPKQRKLEFLMLKTRLSDGFLLYEYSRRFGRDFPEEFSGALERVAEEGLGKLTDSSFRPTKKGFDFHNRLVSHLIETI